MRDLARSPNTILADSIITYQWERRFTVTNLSPNTYRTDSLKVGDKYYVDRNYKLTAIPKDLQNLFWILTENDDKDVSDQYWLSFYVNQAVTLFIAFDASITPLPMWLQEWDSTGQQIKTTDDVPLNVYTKNFPAGTIVLGGNYGNNSGSMYVVLLKSGLPAI